MKNKIKREKGIVRTSIVSIVANIFLSIFKMIIGLISNSIAIVLDAVNNITDVLSSVITIVGTKLAHKPADEKHPYGYGRIEYITATIIAMIILYAGITSLTESIKKIINPVVPTYTMVTIIILVVAIITKIVLGLYVIKKSKDYKSDSLYNSGYDALTDVFISAATLVAALIFIIFDLPVEAYLALVISLVIIRSGIIMIKTTVSQILGERIDKDLSLEIKHTINSFPEVEGVYDLILNNYGPDTLMGSLHVEVSDEMSAVEIDHLARKITKVVYEKNNVIITAVGIYSYNKNDKEIMTIKKEINDIIKNYKGIKQMHGFYVNKESRDINFDLIFDFSVKDKVELYKRIEKEVKEKYPKYNIFITMDVDISD